MRKMTAAAILFAALTIFAACGGPVQPVVAVTPAPSDAPSVKYFFECVKTANGYASQYFIKDKSERVTIFIDGGDIYYGFTTVQDKPVSILDGSTFTADFAKSEETYMMLIGGKFTLYVNGIDCTAQY
jgi:mannose-1-phosphate guanylyltransferase